MRMKWTTYVDTIRYKQEVKFLFILGKFSGCLVLYWAERTLGLRWSLDLLGFGLF